MSKRPFTRLVLACVVVTIAAHVAGQAQPASPSTSTLLTNAWVIDGTGKPVMNGAWIRVDGDRIAAMGQGAPLSVPGAQVMDLRGKTVVPGLADMHVHLGNLDQAKWMLKLLIAHGVTNIKEAGNQLGNDAAIRRWVKDDPAVPHLYISGVTLNGSKDEQRFLQPGGLVRNMLENNAAFGVDFIKLHNFVSSKALDQIVRFGRAHDLYVTGHVPLGMTSLAAIDIGMTILEHVRLRAWEVIDDPEILSKYPMDIPIMIREGFWSSFEANSASAARTLKAFETRKARFFIDPTLVTAEALANADDPATTGSPELSMISAPLRKDWGGGAADRYGVMNAEEFERAKNSVLGQAKFIGMAHARGIRVLTGTDTPVPWIIPGTSLLRELELLVLGGLTPVEAIHASTGQAAEAFRNKTRGVLAAGQAADLVIVNGDVNADIHTIRNIEKVMIGGQLHDRARLLQDAARLAAEQRTPSILGDHDE